ncbi:hypothetical protein SAMN06297358_2096 [Pedobacter xixiisoli]|uniref:Uncharacterized protein n=1 Tax=Pedobacter xixiisoli TaxID=1476464 RepID=A0A285ZZV0_9SPHI|nr:hypothetical protein SAMN06297358_2096 [Pedobacter xixiisoli]
MSYAKASVLHTFDASTCEASLNTYENINTNEKSLIPAGIEAKISPNICVHTIAFEGRTVVKPSLLIPLKPSIKRYQ